MSTNFHYIRKNVEGGYVKILNQPTEEMVADSFPEATGRLNFEKQRDYLIGNHTNLSYEKIHGEV